MGTPEQSGSEASCQLLQEGNKLKPTIMKELVVVDECVADNISLQQWIKYKCLYNHKSTAKLMRIKLAILG